MKQHACGRGTVVNSNRRVFIPTLVEADKKEERLEKEFAKDPCAAYARQSVRAACAMFVSDSV
jgi:hypothetical protein